MTSKTRTLPLVIPVIYRMSAEFELRSLLQKNRLGTKAETCWWTIEAGTDISELWVSIYQFVVDCRGASCKPGNVCAESLWNGTVGRTELEDRHCIACGLSLAHDAYGTLVGRHGDDVPVWHDFRDGLAAVLSDAGYLA